MPGGRPSLYKAEYAEQAYKLCLLGATDERLAEFFKIRISTLHNWKTKHKEFMSALKEGRDVADANIGKSLYQRAMGYSAQEDKVFNNNGEPLIVPTIKHYPPDTTAMIFWLKNRQRAYWRDKVDAEVTGKDGGPIESVIKFKPAKLDQDN